MYQWYINIIFPRNWEGASKSHQNKFTQNKIHETYDSQKKKKENWTKVNYLEIFDKNKTQ